jgi:hypothetical protein
MTLPFERTNAVNYTREFLYELIDPKKTPKIPKIIRQRALSLLRHYPNEYNMERASEKQQEFEEPVFGKDEFAKKYAINCCSVCGLGKNGAVTGYVCNHPSCPTRISC